MLPEGASGCVSPQRGRTQDCVARGLPAGASVSLTVREIGGSTYLVDWLPPVDARGNVPFPYGRPTAGRTVFVVTAGGVTVAFEVEFA